MTDKGFKDTRKKISAYLDEWVPLLGLDRWNLVIEYHRFKDPEEAVGRAYPTWQYQHGVIEFFCPDIEERSDEFVERTVIHELCHFLVNETREWGTEAIRTVSSDAQAAARKHEEHVVVQLARAFFSTKHAKLKVKGKLNGKR